MFQVELPPDTTPMWRVPITTGALTPAQQQHLDHLRDTLRCGEQIARGHNLPALAAMLAHCLDCCEAVAGGQ